MTPHAQFIEAHGGDDLRLCHCGTCRDATDAAFKLYAQMIAHDCPTWAMQVIAVLEVIAKIGGNHLTKPGAMDQVQLLVATWASRYAIADYQAKKLKTLLENDANA